MKKAKLKIKTAVPKRRQRLTKTVHAKMKPRLYYTDPKHHAKIMATAKYGTCLWMEGEAIERNFCGQPIAGIGFSWCNEHMKRVYTCKPKPRQG